MLFLCRDEPNKKGTSTDCKSTEHRCFVILQLFTCLEIELDNPFKPFSSVLQIVSIRNLDDSQRISGKSMFRLELGSV